MKTAEEVCEALRDVVLNRQRIIVLLRHTGRSTEAADRFRAFLTEEKREALLKPAGANPDFVKLGESFGIDAVRASSPEELGTAVARGRRLNVWKTKPM